MSSRLDRIRRTVEHHRVNGGPYPVEDVEWLISEVDHKRDSLDAATQRLDRARAERDEVGRRAVAAEQRERIRTEERAEELARLTAERDQLKSELARWESGLRRKCWPTVEKVPDGIHYAAELARAQGTEGGEDHDRLLRGAATRLRDLSDVASVLLADRDRCAAERDQLKADMTKARTAANVVATALDRLGARIHRDLHVESSYIDLSDKPQLAETLAGFSTYAEECLEALDDPAVVATLSAGSDPPPSMLPAEPGVGAEAGEQHG